MCVPPPFCGVHLEWFGTKGQESVRIEISWYQSFRSLTYLQALSIRAPLEIEDRTGLGLQAVQDGIMCRTLQVAWGHRPC